MGSEIGEGSGRSKSRKSEIFSKAEQVCRICHFGAEDKSKEVEIIPLGCDCKGGIGSSHLHCAETWFSHKGDRQCEICGKTAKNIKRNREETTILMMEWNDMRLVAETLETSRESSCCWKKSFYLALFIVALLLLGFLKENNFS